jgi:hypothetical protein
MYDSEKPNSLKYRLRRSENMDAPVQMRRLPRRNALALGGKSLRWAT